MRRGLFGRNVIQPKVVASVSSDRFLDFDGVLHGFSRPVFDDECISPLAAYLAVTRCESRHYLSALQTRRRFTGLPPILE